MRYRRIRSAIAELQALAVQSGDDRCSAFLSIDETVIAMMAAAVDVVEAAGVRWTAATTPQRICAGAVAALQPGGRPAQPLRHRQRKPPIVCRAGGMKSGFPSARI